MIKHFFQKLQWSLSRVSVAFYSAIEAVLYEKPSMPPLLLQQHSVSVIPNNQLNSSIKFTIEFKTSPELFSIVNLSLIHLLRIHSFHSIETTKAPSTEQKDRILHTTKTTSEPVIAVKGDYGQGTTRGGTVSESEKKI